MSACNSSDDYNLNINLRKRSNRFSQKMDKMDKMDKKFNESGGDDEDNFYDSNQDKMYFSKCIQSSSMY